MRSFIITIVCSLIFVQLIFGENQPIANFQTPRLIYDLTTVDANNSGENLYTEERVANRDAENGEESYSFFFSTDCENFVDCALQIPTIANFTRENFGNRTGVDLTISLRLRKDSIKSFKMNETDFKPRFLKGFKLRLVVTLDEDTTCDDLKTLKYTAWSDFSQSKPWILLSSISVEVGFGYNEAILSCTPEVIRQPFVIYGRKLQLLTFRLGRETIGVVESFSLFQKRMNMIDEKHTKFVKDTAYTDVIKLAPTKTIFYPAPQSIGNDGHRRLLIDYSDKWTSLKSKDKSIVVQIPKINENRTVEYSLITYVESESIAGEIDTERYLWFTPAALRTISEYFDLLILKPDQWKKLNSMETQQFYETLRETESESKFHLNTILDYSDTLDSTVFNNEYADVSSTNFNWSKIEDEIKKRESIDECDPITNIKLNGLIFKIETSSPNVTQAKVNKEFATRLSQNFQIGCAFRDDYFTVINDIESVASSVVNACQEINGSFYILKSGLFLFPDEEDPDNNFLYQNSIRKELESLDKFRQVILQTDPYSTVYFQLELHLSDIFFRDEYHVTAFCNSKVFKQNLFIEAISNWAKLNMFPAILMSAFDTYSKYSSSWLSVVRYAPYDIIHLNGTKWKEDLDYELHVTALYPFFVRRNYPENINGWNIDPCVEWTEIAPEIGSDFFRGSVIGAIFNVNNIRSEEKISKDEIGTMTRFVMHRFHLTEIISSDCQRVLKAIKMLTTTGVIDKNKKFFLSCENVTVEFFKEVEDAKLTSVQGIHVKLPEIKSIEVGLFHNGNFSLKMGISMSTLDCMAAIRTFVLRNLSDSQIKKVLNTTTYLVCTEELNVLSQDDILSLGALFDYHLYIRRGFQTFQPHLNIYFRIELDTELNQLTMERYLRLLSHFKKFAGAYNLSYFMVEAFDKETEGTSGWWTIQNYTNLTNTEFFTERESEFSDRPTWRPPPLVFSVPSISKNGVGNATATEDSKVVLMVASISSVLLIIFVLLSSYLVVRNKMLRSVLSNEEVKEFLNGKKLPLNIEVEEIGCTAEYIKFNPDYELRLADFEIDETCVLGEGNFGTVFKGIVKGNDSAIKLPHTDCTKGTYKNFLSEVKVLCYIGSYPNVVLFFGAYIKEIRQGVLYIATELCSKGSLEGLLRKTKTVTSSKRGTVYENAPSTSGPTLSFHDLHRFALEMATGMDYIARKRVVHGDLSTRNVLLDENFTCKIGDFGLSRKLYEYNKYVKKSQEPLPWKWMAYESLTKMEFTSKSDVWSCGVTLWEIYSLGTTPYGGLNWSMDFTNMLRKGLRLTRPDFATENIYMKMLDCWQIETEKRPTFEELAEFFKQMYNPLYANMEA